jgi:hypothetical protein
LIRECLGGADNDGTGILTRSDLTSASLDLASQDGSADLALELPIASIRF